MTMNVFNVLYCRYIDQIKLQQIQDYNNKHQGYLDRIGKGQQIQIRKKQRQIKQKQKYISSNININKTNNEKKKNSYINEANHKHIKVDKLSNKQVNDNQQRPINIKSNNNIDINYNDYQQQKFYKNPQDNQYYQKDNKINIKDNKYNNIHHNSQQLMQQKSKNIKQNSMIQKYQKPIKPLLNSQFMSEFPQQFQQNIVLHQCPEGCGRRFKEQALQKHIRICQKIFQQKRKPFKVDVVDEEAKNLSNKNIKKNIKNSKINVNTTNNNEINTNNEKIPKWKKDSQRLRQGIRKPQAGVTSSIQEEDLDDRKQCPGCGRKFNETAADRHIPNCVKKAKKK